MSPHSLATDYCYFQENMYRVLGGIKQFLFVQFFIHVSLYQFLELKKIASTLKEHHFFNAVRILFFYLPMFQCNKWVRLERWAHLEKSIQTYFWHYLPRTNVPTFPYSIKTNTHKKNVHDLEYPSWWLNLRHEWVVKCHKSRAIGETTWECWGLWHDWAAYLLVESQKELEYLGVLLTERRH